MFIGNEGFWVIVSEVSGPVIDSNPFAVRKTNEKQSTPGVDISHRAKSQNSEFPEVENKGHFSPKNPN